MKALIVTGDDFGLSTAVNEAVEEAHVRGILTAASLMVGGDACGDAARRARRLPSLSVGLHLVVVRGRPVLPPRAIPDIVGGDGRFGNGLVRAGFRYFFDLAARKQLGNEIRAQFEAFRDTGLPLDHVDAHCHMHLHPTVLGFLMETGRAFGLRSVRLPREPLPGLAERRLLSWLLLRPWVAVMRLRIDRAGLRRNDHLIGMADTGRLDEERLLKLLSRIPDGVTEIPFHPAVRSPASGDRAAAGPGDGEELLALTSPRVAEALRLQGVERASYGRLSKIFCSRRARAS